MWRYTYKTVFMLISAKHDILKLYKFEHLHMYSTPIHAFLEFFSPVGLLRTTFFPSHWLLSHKTIVETINSGESGMNAAVMTIIYPRKEYCPSQGLNQRPPVLKSDTLQIWGSASINETYKFKHKLS